ncbi:MAG: site-specific integrase [Longicatena sp.]
MLERNAGIKKANGMGSVYRLQGNRRKPWVACVTAEYISTSDSKKQKRKIIGYYETEEMATFSLWNYNKNPILFEEIQKAGAITFEAVYLDWSSSKYRNVSQNAINGYKAAYAKCQSIKDRPIIDIKTMHFQRIMDDSNLSLASDLKLKSLMVLVCEYAMQNDIISKNYAKYVIVNRKNATPSIHKPFTEQEIDILFDHDNIPFVDTILIMIYTGFRVGELFAIERKDVDIKNMTICGGSKSEAGKNRLVPIHERIQPYVLNYYRQRQEYLICELDSGDKINYHSYRKEYFNRIMGMLGMEHLPHDCRHTFATRLSNVGANTSAIKKLIGHSSYLTTEKIYTHKDLGQLRRAITSLK